MKDILLKIADGVIDLKKSGWITKRIFISLEDVGKFGYESGYLGKIGDFCRIPIYSDESVSSGRIRIACSKTSSRDRD